MLLCLLQINLFVKCLIGSRTGNRHPHDIIIKRIVRPVFSKLFDKSAVHFTHQFLIIRIFGLIPGIHDNFHDLRPRPVKFAGNHAGSILIIPEISCNKALHRLICNLHSAVCIHFVSSSAVCFIPVRQLLFRRQISFLMYAF